MKTQICLLASLAAPLLLMPLSSCTLLHRQRYRLRTETLDSLQQIRESKSALQASARTVRLHLLDDSSSAESFVEILPSGNFEFSVQDGFKGQGRSIRIYGKQQQGSKLRDSAFSQASLNASREQQEGQTAIHLRKQQEQLSEKKKGSVPLWFWLLLLVPVVLLSRSVLSKTLMRHTPERK